MNTPRQFWLILIGAILTMAVIACSCGSIIPTPTVSSEPIPGLAGTWQTDENAVIEIAWQGGQYVVVSYTWQGTSYDITSQSWTGSSLTWSLYDSDAGLTYTFTTLSLSGDSLDVNVSLSDGRSGTLTLQRTP